LCMRFIAVDERAVDVKQDGFYRDLIGHMDLAEGGTYALRCWHSVRSLRSSVALLMKR
jgi:hypothetical protein